MAIGHLLKTCLPIKDKTVLITQDPSSSDNWILPRTDNYGGFLGQMRQPLEWRRIDSGKPITTC